MQFTLNPDLHYGWFSIPDRYTVYIYLKDLEKNPSGSISYVMDAIFQLVHILGQTLPDDVDIWVDWDSDAPIPRCKITPLNLVEEHPIDQMYKYLGGIAQRYFPLAKLVLYAYNHMKDPE